jgi:hypothetical protein
MARSTTRVDGRPLTRAECGESGITARLLSEDWDAMTAAANASANHVKSLDRWVKKVRELNPRLDDAQAERMAERLKKDHYQRMGRLSALARRTAREAQAELDRAPAGPASDGT